MLYSVDTGRYVTKLPHEREFEGWMGNLPVADYQSIIDELSARIDTQDIHTAGWIPGNDWNGTVYQPIYYACGQNKTQAGMFFGLILFNLLMNRQEDVWGFGRYEKNGVPIESMTYFILNNPPPSE